MVTRRCIIIVSIVSDFGKLFAAAKKNSAPVISGAERNAFSDFVGKSSLEPYSADVERFVKSGLFGLAHDSFLWADVFVCLLKIDGNSGSGLKAVFVLFLLDLQHYDVFVGHSAVIDGVALPEKRSSAV